MKKQLLKGVSMLTLLVAVAYATAVVANAQTARLVISNVPFDFVVGDQTMAAGEYRLTPASAISSTLIIRSDDTKSSAMRLTNSINPSPEKKNARLVFHRYGNQYFLSEVWTGGEGEGRQLIKSRRERAVQRELAQVFTGQHPYAVVEIAAALR